MANRNSPNPHNETTRVQPWVAVVLPPLLLLLIIGLDFATGSETSVSLFYLIPISTAVWLAGTRLGVIVCIGASAASLCVSVLENATAAMDWWNAGMWFGMYLTFALVLGHLRDHNQEFPIFRLLRRAMLIAVGVACMLVAAGLLVQRKALALRKIEARTNAPTTNVGPAAPLSGVEVAGLLRELATQTPLVLRTSRPVLLGSRDPNGPSCVPVINTGDVKQVLPANPADLDGGPGTKMSTLLFFDRKEIRGPLQDFVWQQTRLKKFLENLDTNNEDAQRPARRLASMAAALSNSLAAYQALPAELVATGFDDPDDWPGYCLTRVDQAVNERDLESARRWSAEFAAAVFSLNDLHRWLDFLVDNQLASLNFQRQCQSLFTSVNPTPADYDIGTTISQFPGGVLTLTDLSNYYEVERQAEKLYSWPEERTREQANDAHQTPASIWIPPMLREGYLKLREVLSPDNQKNWDQAARTPYEHSYLVNMLYRAWCADSAEQLRLVLQQFDKNNPNASLTELLDVLMYRGQSFAGLEWADRFQPQLMDAAASMTGPDTQAFMVACRWTNQFYAAPAEYGTTLTLREAMQSKKLDCVRATDMIGALFRNSGRTQFGHVWWTAGTASHSVAAYLTRDNDQLKTLLADGMNPAPELEVWPEAYFHGHAYPARLANDAPPYAVELFVRGLDNYIFAEGYIVRGPNAGMLSRAGIPYLPLREHKLSTKVFDGPYPE